MGEKLLHFVEAAEHHPEFEQELPSFVAKIKRVFSLAEVGNYAVHIERTQPLSAPPASRYPHNLIDIRANPLGSRFGLGISRRRPTLPCRMHRLGWPLLTASRIGRLGLVP